MAVMLNGGEVLLNSDGSVAIHGDCCCPPPILPRCKCLDPDENVVDVPDIQIDFGGSYSPTDLDIDYLGNNYTCPAPLTSNVVSASAVLSCDQWCPCHFGSGSACGPYTTLSFSSYEQVCVKPYAGVGFDYITFFYAFILRAYRMNNVHPEEVVAEATTELAVRLGNDAGGAPAPGVPATPRYCYKDGGRCTYGKKWIATDNGKDCLTGYQSPTTIGAACSTNGYDASGITFGISVL